MPLMFPFWILVVIAMFTSRSGEAIAQIGLKSTKQTPATKEYDLSQIKNALRVALSEAHFHARAMGKQSCHDSFWNPSIGTNGGWDDASRI